MDDGKARLNPGPGNYNIDSVAFDKNSRFHMGQRLPPLKGASENPGAGSYDPSPQKIQKNGPAFSMKMKLQDPLSKNGNPGPGSYDQQ